MLDFLNPLGLVAKYAIIGAVSLLLGIFLAGIFGMNMEMTYLNGAISGALGGAIGGFIRQKQGKKN